MHRDFYIVMTKNEENSIEFDGVVVEVLPGSMFRVHPLNAEGVMIDGGKEVRVTAHACGKIRKHRIKIFLTDKVRVLVSIHDTTKGRITHRHERDRGAA